MGNTVIPKFALQFLKDLKANNNRDWFTNNKSTYQKAHGEVKDFYEAVMADLNRHDSIEKLKHFRIYRDVRFSKDKTPYQPHFACSFARAGAERRGGYYIRIRPGESAIATGFWDPEPKDLLRIRKEIEQSGDELLEVINKPAFKKIWGDIQGDAVKTAPKGFDKEHPHIDLIRRKQFIFVRNFTDKEVLAPDFFEEVTKSYKAIRPYFDLMSEILTTNLNGESVLN